MKPATQVLIERYQKHLYAIAFNICRNQQDAEDVVQDTFIQYHTYKKEFDTEEHIRAWLIRVAINKAKNITRSFWHRNKCNLEEYMETLTFETPESETLFDTVMNKEKYKQAFDTLSASDNFSLEVDKMSILNRKHKLKTIAAAIAACLIVTAGTGTAYASDLGGIQRKVQLWIHGDQTTATLTINSDGSYTGTYADKDGKNKEFGGGGIAFNQDGSERSLTQEEIMEELNAPDIEYEKDGSVILYYKNQSIDITHKFNKDNICYVKLVDGDDSLYVTVKYNNGYASSPNKYISPWEFN